MEGWPLNPVDIGVIVVLLLSALLAFARGFVREVLSIAGWVGAAVVTLQLFPMARPFLREYITMELLADVLTGVGIFIGTLIVFSVVSHFIAKAVSGSALSAVDRSLGFLFGLLRGGVVLALGYLLLVWLMPNPTEHPDIVQEARTRPMIERGADMLRSLVPSEMMAQADQAGTGARQTIEDGTRVLDLLQQTPAPRGAAPTGEPGDVGYDRLQRNQLDQLIQSTD